MTPGLKSAATLIGLLVMLVAASAWGWSQLTEPLPGKAEPPICADTTYAVGDEVYPQDVTVSVLNASEREGLAGRTMQLLVTDGFGEGTTGNAPKGTDVRVAEVWTNGAGDPAVALVKSRFGKVVVREDTSARDTPGVIVVVGDLFDELADGKASVVAKSDSVICSPPVD